MNAGKPSVAIIGAGIAGLAAGDRLAGEGFPVTIFEARKRAGGRIDTDYSFADIPIERGAEFVHGRHPDLLGAIEGAGLHADTRQFQPLVLQDGKDVSPASYWGRVFEELANPDARDEPIATRVRELVESGDWSEAEARTMRRYVEGYMAADFERVSAKALSQEERAQEAISGEFNARIREGYDALLRYLVRRLEQAGAGIRFGCVVERVRWKRASVTLDVRGTDNPAPETFDRTIVTLPVSLLQMREGVAGVRFEPALPEKVAAARAIGMGGVVKLFFRFRGRLAQLPGLGGEIGAKLERMTFLQTPDGHFPTWWRIGSEEQPILVAWLGGPRAERLSGRSDDDLLSLGKETLAQALGISAAQLESHVAAATAAEWQSDPWSRGAYSWIPVGATGSPAILAAPVDGTLFFAGEATDTAGFRGTVHGALVTGLRAAGELIAAT